MCEQKEAEKVLDRLPKKMQNALASAYWETKNNPHSSIDPWHEWVVCEMNKEKYNEYR